MTDEYIKAVVDYTKSMQSTGFQPKSALFSHLIYLNTLLDLSFDEQNLLETNNDEYSKNMRTTLGVLKINISDSKYAFFKGLLDRIIGYYSQPNESSNGSHRCKLKKDTIEFLNMLHKDYVPFLDDVL
jgi:hypothetical protein